MESDHIIDQRYFSFNRFGNSLVQAPIWEVENESFLQQWFSVVVSNGMYSIMEDSTNHGQRNHLEISVGEEGRDAVALSHICSPQKPPEWLLLPYNPLVLFFNIFFKLYNGGNSSQKLLPLVLKFSYWLWNSTQSLSDTK